MLAARPTTAGAENNIYGGAARTPARGLVKNRNALQENALRHGPMTVGPKNLAQTPYRSKNNQLPGNGKPATQMKSRPLLDKTPFHNRIGQPLNTKTPFGKGSSNLSKIILLDTNLLHPKTPDSVLRPSSTRKHARVPRSAEKNFQTPFTTGNHWDVGDVSLELETEDNVEEAEIVDHDEIEYMPPKMPEQPYVPPFDFPMPNYKELGCALNTAMRSYPVEEVIIPEVQPIVQESTVDLILPELPDDDIFAALGGVLRTRAASTTIVPTRTGTTATAASSKPKPISRLTTRTAPASTSTSTAVSKIKPSTTLSSGVPPTRPRAVTASAASSSRLTRVASVTAKTTQPATTTAAVSRSTAGVGPVTKDVRRPATSASTYRAGGISSTRPVSTLSRNPLGPKKAQNDDCEVLEFGKTSGLVGEDFCFDIDAV
ncbi:hypothetical protein ONZ45_g10366 [Pleurotus djamor]|nr:hypothetical protein ONZ45_g10366 [Pleurotus djamor]